MGSSRKLTPIAFDLETTGFHVSDSITVAGLRLPLGPRVLLNTDGRRTQSGLEEQVERESGLSEVSVVVCENEAELLERLTAEAQRVFSGQNRMLVAYNGETWRGGFDLSFLRTRCGVHEAEWAFADVPYSDLLDVIQKRVNTTVQGDDGPEDINDLCGAYDVVIGGSHCDPFEDSEEAVQAAEDGRFVQLLLHNIADIERTQQLAEWTQRYVPISDFRLKNLSTPIGGGR